MKNAIKYLIIVILFFLTGGVSGTDCGGTVSCNCGYNLTSSHNMTYDLENCSGNGIVIGSDGITLDCNGHSINGTGPGYGIYLNNKTGNVIMNCEITDFVNGIALSSSPGTRIVNNSIAKIRSNIRSYGIYSFNQDNISIKDCSVEGYDYGIYFFVTSDSAIINNTLKLNNYGIYADSVDGEEMEFLDIINEYRENNSIPKLSLSSSLTRSAKGHSQDMANHDYVNHTGIDNRTSGDRIRDAGYTYNTYLGENIAAGYPDYSAAFIFDGWKNSSKHNLSMLNSSYKVIGIGRAYNPNSDHKMYWTTDFGGYNDTLNNPFLSHTSQNNKIENNLVNMNDYGIFIYYSNNTEISSNVACSNNISDFNITNSSGNYGDNNTCNNSDGWNDNNKTGCSYVCPLCEDNDNDGYGFCPACNTIHGCRYNGNDCNNGNASINPGMTEAYNYIDDDCDGSIDEGFCDTNDNCSSLEFCNMSHKCQSKKQNFESCTNDYECLFDNCAEGICIHPCDFNHDGIIIHDYSDLMTAYKYFLRIENYNKISFQDWKSMEREYQCFVNIQ